MKTLFVALSILLVTGSQLAAAPKNKMPNPDFTKGDPIPAGAEHDWNLGASGARGWMFSDTMVTTDARQILITQIAKGSPADGLLETGDVLLGVAGKPFAYDPRTEFGKALSAAESDIGGGDLTLSRWRDGKTEKVTLQLPVLGSYSATAPYDCPKSQRILEQGYKVLAKQVGAPDYWQIPITRSLNALALLASGNPDYLPIVRKEAQWAANFSTNGYKTWHYGYVITLLSEYVLATGDESVMPGLRRLALESARGQSAVGSWGHKFSGDDGRLLGYGMMNSPGLPLTISLVLARTAGVNDPEVATAIERSARLLRFYIGKGAIPYGDHAPWIKTHEDNGKCGMAAVLFDLLDEPAGAEFFSRMSTASHGAERDTGHTGNFFNLLWSMPSITRSGPHASGAWMREFGGWYFDLVRRHDGTFGHQGPPQMRGDSYRNWDCTGAYLLAYAMPLQKIYLTGKRSSKIPQLDAQSAQRLIRDGRGWSNKDRNSVYDELSQDALLRRLGSWSPVVRQRAALSLGRRKGEPPIAALIDMLESPQIDTRLGACQSLAQFRGKSAAAVPALREALRDEDLWLRVQAAETLASIGKPAMAAVPQLLEILAHGPSKDDPRAMEQRYLCFTVFGQLLKRSLDDVDRDLLRKAVTAGLQNQDGRARGNIGGIYQQLSYEEIKPLLPAIHDAIVTPAPSGIMFDSGIRLAGIDLLATHRIKEGIPLCIEVMEIQKWGKGKRIPRCINTLKKYGPAAKAVLPQLRLLEKDLSAHREAKKLQAHIQTLRVLIQDLDSATDTVELRSIN